MRIILALAIHLLVTFVKLLRPGGVRAVAAESLLLKHQLLISRRARQHAPNLTTLDRFLIGLTTLFLMPSFKKFNNIRCYELSGRTICPS